jgi:hypothetical protein
MSAENFEVKAWIRALLAADATIAAAVGSRIYSDLAPPNSAHPYIIVNLQGGSDLNALGARGLSEKLYQVKVIGRGDNPGALKAVADQIDTLLHMAASATATLACWCLREQEIDYPEVSGDIRFQHVGGIYRVVAQGTA